MDRVEAAQERNEKLTFHLIRVMSGQQSAQAKRSKELDKQIAALGKQIAAFLSGIARSNGHGRKAM